MTTYSSYEELVMNYLDTLKEYRDILSYYYEIKQTVVAYSKDTITIEECVHNIIGIILREVNENEQKCTDLNCD